MNSAGALKIRAFAPDPIETVTLIRELTTAGPLHVPAPDDDTACGPDSVSPKPSALDAAACKDSPHNAAPLYLRATLRSDDDAVGKGPHHPRFVRIAAKA